MPPKKKETDASAAEPRRSSRVASQPAKPAPEPKAAPKKAPASKKRSVEDATSGEADKETKPASKKPKSTTEKTEKKAPASKKQANGDDDKAEKPKSTVTKPESKKAPSSKKSASTSKPASSAKPQSKKAEAPASKKQDNGDIPEETAAEVEKEIEAAPDAKDAGEGISEGDVLPSITVQDNKGQDVDVSTLCDSDHGLVIFVYPKANTPGCTTQACSYRDNYAEFEKLGYKVFGLSADTVSAQDKWATTKEFNYNLLADTKHELLKVLGAFVPPKNIKRSHFIFEKGTGKLIEKKLGVKPADDTKNALSFIQSHHK